MNQTTKSPEDRQKTPLAARAGTSHNNPSSALAVSKPKLGAHHHPQTA